MPNQEIKFDQNNYRNHNENNRNLIKKSLKECGAGRSILIDKEGVIIAGNGVYEQAQKLKIPTQVVKTDGSKLLVVQRTDISTDDEKRKKLALKFLKDNGLNVPVFCDIACAIGQQEINISIHNGEGIIFQEYTEKCSPKALIKKFGLNKPIYAALCKNGLFSRIKVK